MFTRRLLYCGLLAPAAGLLSLAIAVRRAPPASDPHRWIGRLVATAGVALALLAIFPIDPGMCYPPGEPASHTLHGLVHGLVATVLFAALAAAPLTLARRVRGKLDWSSRRPFSLATGLTVAVTYALTVVLSSLDQPGVWTNAPAGLTERVAVIAGAGWCAVLAGRLLETTARRTVNHVTADQA